MASELELQPDQQEQVGLVVGDEDLHRSGTGVRADGSVKKKLEPTPGWLCTHTRPPCISTCRFTMLRPIPAPRVAPAAPVR